MLPCASTLPCVAENETLTTLLEGSRAAPRKACLTHAASVGAGGIGAWDLYGRLDAEAEGGRAGGLGIPL